MNESIQSITRKLGIEINRHLYSEYLNGLHPDLMSYEKKQDLKTAQKNTSAIHKMILAGLSFVDAAQKFPRYYDVYSACRSSFYLQLLDIAINEIELKKINNHEFVLRKITKAKTMDEFDAVLFEILVACRYSKDFKHRTVSFVPEGAEKSPDIIVTGKHDEFYVECKRFNRKNDFITNSEAEIQKYLRPLIDQYRNRLSLKVDLILFDDIRNIGLDKFQKAIDLNLQGRNEELSMTQFKLTCRIGEKIESSHLICSPSPQLEMLIGDFRRGDVWHDVVSDMTASYAAPSWIEEIGWYIGIRYKFGSIELLRKVEQFNLQTARKGIAQLATTGDNGRLHLWVDRFTHVDFRMMLYSEFYQQLMRDPFKNRFDSIFFNETLNLVTPDGNPDIWENSHFWKNPFFSNNKKAKLIFTRVS